MPARQEIRFCHTADGVQLAMGLYGSGPPIVRAATWLTHIERDGESDLNRQWIDALSRHYTYVTYDMRGCGLSSRQAEDVSFDAWVRDLGAVVDSLGLGRFPLMGFSQGAAIAIRYAALHPERVSALVLFGPFATSYLSTTNTDPRIREEAEMLLTLVKLGWGQHSPALRQVFVSKFMPHASAERRRGFDDYQRLTADAAMAERCMRTMFGIDVRADAKRVLCPTLVFHARRDQLINFEQGRKVAALIPGARLVPLESDNHLPFADEPAWPAVEAELRGFLGDAAPLQAARLTPRQAEVLAQVSAGRTDKAIARLLQLSPRTVEMHVAGAMKALDCATRAEAVAKAATAGLLPSR